MDEKVRMRKLFSVLRGGSDRLTEDGRRTERFVQSFVWVELSQYLYGLQDSCRTLVRVEEKTLTRESFSHVLHCTLYFSKEALDIFL